MPDSKVLSEKRQELGVKAKKFADISAQIKTPEDYGKKEVQDALGASDAIEAKSKLIAFDAEIRDIGSDIDRLTLEEMKAENQSRLSSLDRPIRRDLPTGTSLELGRTFGRLAVDSRDFVELKAAGFKTPGSGFKVEIPDDVGLKTLLQTSAGWQPRTGNGDRVVSKIIRPVQVLDMIPSDTTELFEIPFMLETTRTQAAAELAEGGTYAEDAFVFSRQTSPVRKVGSEIPVTDEQLEDVPTMRALLDNRLTFGLRARLDLQIIVGDGTGSNLTGVINAANLQSQAKGADPTANAIFKAMTNVRVTGRSVPDAVMIHGLDWQNIRLAQNAQGDYQFGAPSATGEDTLWGLPVVQTEALTQGTALTGAFQTYSQLWYRKGIEIQVGYIANQFIQGQKTLRADVRAAFVVYRGQAFCKVTGI